MWLQDNIDILNDPNTIFVACISYGKDSLAMLRAIKLLGLPLHRIIHTEVWATNTIPADLPPMVEFKVKADKIIKELYGIEVEHVCAMAKMEDAAHYTSASRERERERDGAPRKRLTYDRMFYNVLQSGKFVGTIKGFPQTIGAWCKKIKYEKVDIRGYILSTFQECIYCRGELKNIRISDAERKLVHNLPQTKHTDSRFRSTEGNGVKGSNSFRKSPANEGRK